jgi:hypothetical protein
MYSKDTWTHYLYLLQFSDGSYYSGVSKRKGDDPSIDGYFGSPMANKTKWASEQPKKIIIAYLFVGDNFEAFQIESDWQRSQFDLADSLCLNAHFGNTHFNTEATKRGGASTGMKNVLSGHLDRIRPASNAKRKRPVIVTYNETGQIIWYPSVSAAAKGLNVHYSTLCNYLANRRKSCSRYLIQYA